MSPIDCVIPLCGVDENGLPELVGSGVLLEIGPKTFLITATHVFTDNADTTFYYPGKEALEKLTGTRIGANRDEEDVCVILLEENTVKEISWSYSALPIYFVEMNDITRKGDQYSIAGFPEESAKFDHSAYKVKPQRLLYNSKASDERTYKKCKVSLASHVVIDHSQKKARDSNGKKVKAPLLNCMSGGAAWKRIRAKKSVPGIPSVRLVGITIEKHDRWAGAVATRINFAIEIIRNEFPELSDLIPLSSTLAIEVIQKPE